MDFEEELQAIPIGIEWEDEDDLSTSKVAGAGKDSKRDPPEGHIKGNSKLIDDNGSKQLNKNGKEEVCGAENGEMEMDDEFDDLFTQIDETLHGNRAPAKPVVPASAATPVACQDNAKKRRNACESEESLSFFLTQENSSCEPPSKRKFPGPAGVLPTLRNGKLGFHESIKSTPAPLVQIVRKPNAPKTSLKANPGQTGAFPKGEELLLSKAPWKTLSKSLQLNVKDKNSIINMINTKWTKEIYVGCEEIKIPFLAVVVTGKLGSATKYKNRHKNPCTKVMDPTGSMIAAFNDQFVEAYADMIVPGTALVLRNCVCSRVGNHVVLTVRKKNLIYLATSVPIETQEKSQGFTPKITVDKEKEIYVLQTSNLVIPEIIKEYQEIMDTIRSRQEEAAVRRNVNLVRDSPRGPLFSSVQTSVTNGRGHPMSRFIPVRPEVTAPYQVTPPQTNPIVPVHPTYEEQESSEFNDDDEDDILLGAMNLEILEDS